MEVATQATGKLPSGMKLKATCVTELEAGSAVPVVLLLQPQSGEAQTVHSASLDIGGGVPFHDFKDAYGNMGRRAVLPQGKVTITSECVAEVPDRVDVNHAAGFTPVEEIPDDVLQYLLPSRYCESDLLEKPAAKITKNTFMRKVQPGYGQAERIRGWIHRKFRYKYGTSDASTSAVTSYRKRVGVCRDFSHVGIALCRALRIPARIVFGYLHQLEPMDLHAWFEAYVGGRWYTFDATQESPRGNRIVVAYGRDAADVAQITEYGPMKVLNQKVTVTQAE